MIHVKNQLAKKIYFGSVEYCVQCYVKIKRERKINLKQGKINHKEAVTKRQIQEIPLIYPKRCTYIVNANKGETIQLSNIFRGALIIIFKTQCLKTKILFSRVSNI